jgi:hypothetical protein
VATIASATFILIAVDSFRKGAPSEGVGGYAVLADTLVPIANNPNTKEGQEALGLSDLESVHFEAFRVRPGDDASCLNLYEPKNPRILAPTKGFVNAGRFSFHSSLASNTDEQMNPWLLLDRKEADGAIPVIADANSMTYVLHRKLGEDFVITNHGEQVRLRFVGALADSIFQSEVPDVAGELPQTLSRAGRLFLPACGQSSQRYGSARRRDRNRSVRVWGRCHTDRHTTR